MDASNMFPLLLHLLSIKAKVKTSYLEKEPLKAVDRSPVVPLKKPKRCSSSRAGIALSGSLKEPPFGCLRCYRKI